MAVIIIVFLLMAQGILAGKTIVIPDAFVDPNFDNLETVARLKRLRPGIKYDDTEGVSLFVETHDVENPGKIAWAADIVFGKGEGEGPSQVTIRYITSPKYFEVDRNYGQFRRDNQEEASSFSHRYRQIKISALTLPEGQEQYVEWVTHSFYEFKLGRTSKAFTLSELLEHVGSMRFRGEVFPKFSDYYDPSGGSLNAVGFSLYLASALGGPLFLEPTSSLGDLKRVTMEALKGTIGSYLQRYALAIDHQAEAPSLLRHRFINYGLAAAGAVTTGNSLFTKVCVAGFGAFDIASSYSRLTVGLAVTELYDHRDFFNVQIVKTTKGLEGEDNWLLDVLNLKRKSLFSGFLKKRAIESLEADILYV